MLYCRNTGILGCWADRIFPKELIHGHVNMMVDDLKKFVLLKYSWTFWRNHYPQSQRLKFQPCAVFLCACPGQLSKDKSCHRTDSCAPPWPGSPSCSLCCTAHSPVASGIVRFPDWLESQSGERTPQELGKKLWSHITQNFSRVITKSWCLLENCTHGEATDAGVTHSHSLVAQ